MRRGGAAIAAVVALLALPAAAQARAFPKDFQWGVAIAGFQVEGGQGTNLNANSDWWLWTHDADNIADGVVTDDRPEDGPGVLDPAQAGRAPGRARPEPEGVPDEHRVEPGVPDLHRRGQRGAGARQARRPGSDPALPQDPARDPRRGDDAVGHDQPLRAAELDPRPDRDPRCARRRSAPNDPVPAIPRSGWLDRHTIGEFRKYAAYLGLEARGRRQPLDHPERAHGRGGQRLRRTSRASSRGTSRRGPGASPVSIDAIVNMADANAVAYKAIKRKDRELPGRLRPQHGRLHAR